MVTKIFQTDPKEFVINDILENLNVIEKKDIDRLSKGLAKLNKIERGLLSYYARLKKGESNE